MDDTLAGAARALRGCGDLLAEAGARLVTIDSGERAFGVGATGRLGELGHDFHLQWQRSLDARCREAAAHRARLVDFGDAVAQAAGHYGDVDDSARRAQPEVP